MHGLLSGALDHADCWFSGRSSWSWTTRHNSSRCFRRRCKSSQRNSQLVSFITTLLLLLSEIVWFALFQSMNRTRTLKGATCSTYHHYRQIQHHRHQTRTIVAMMIIVGKTCRRRRHVCAIFQACCAIFCRWTCKYCCFCILLWKLTYMMMIWVILRCWGNSSMVCQQNSDAL